MEAKKRHKSAPAKQTRFREPEPVHRSRLPLVVSKSFPSVIDLDNESDLTASTYAAPVSFEAFYISPTRVRASLSRLNLSSSSTSLHTSKCISGSTPRQVAQSPISSSTPSNQHQIPSTPPKRPNGTFSTFGDISRHVERMREQQLTSPLVSRDKPKSPPLSRATASSSQYSSSVPSTPSNLNGKSRFANGNGISGHLPNPETSPKIHIIDDDVDLFALPVLRPSYVSAEEFEHNAALLRHAEDNASSLRQKAKESKDNARKAWDDFRTPPLTAPRVTVPWPCSKSELDAMDSQVRYGNTQETLVTQTTGGEQVTRHDLSHLLDKEWLNDTCINAYLHLVRMRSKECMEKGKSQPKSWVFGSFFLTKLCGGANGYDYSGVRRISSRAKIDIFALDKVLFPLNLGNHWTMACVNMQMKRIEYYDSLGGVSKSCIDALRRWVADEWKDKKPDQAPIDTSSWATFTPKKIPWQRNGYDCGVFAIMFGDYLSQGKPFDFEQDDMPAIRANILHFILKNQPLPIRE